MKDNILVELSIEFAVNIAIGTFFKNFPYPKKLYKFKKQDTSFWSFLHDVSNLFLSFTDRK